MWNNVHEWAVGLGGGRPLFASSQKGALGVAYRRDRQRRAGSTAFRGRRISAIASSEVGGRSWTTTGRLHGISGQEDIGHREFRSRRAFVDPLAANA
jgi:hypothetical protein